MTRSVALGILAVGLSALAAPCAFAVPTMTITVGLVNQTATLTSVSSTFGAGSYAAAAGTFDGFAYGGVLVTTSGDAMQTQFSSVSDTTSGPGAISFTVTDSGFTTGSPSINFASMQVSGSATATNATNNQTIDFNGNAAPLSGLSTSQNSGALSLNTNPGVFPSSSTVYNTSGINLNTPSPTASITNKWTLDLSPSSVVNGGLLATNLSTSSVVVPEPAAIGLLGIGGAVAMLGFRRRNANVSVR